MSTTDKAKGKIKEAMGNLTGDPELRKEGQAQQHKGHHLAQAAEARAVTEKHEREAELFEDEELRRQPRDPSPPRRQPRDPSPPRRGRRLDR